MSKLTETDEAMLIYFWKEKGSLTRWASWEERKELIRASRPDIVEAWEKMIAARNHLSALIDQLYEQNLNQTYAPEE